MACHFLLKFNTNTIFLIKMTINSKKKKEKKVGRSHSSTNLLTVWLERKQLVLSLHLQPACCESTHHVVSGKFHCVFAKE